MESAAQISSRNFNEAGLKGSLKLVAQNLSA